MFKEKAIIILFIMSFIFITGFGLTLKDRVLNRVKKGYFNNFKFEYETSGERRFKKVGKLLDKCSQIIEPHWFIEGSESNGFTIMYGGNIKLDAYPLLQNKIRYRPEIWCKN